MKLLSVRAAGVLADTINDANSTRKVYLLAAGLAVLGLALIAITVWFWRSTRHDPELLGPLEVLGDRKFRRLEGSEQRDVLDKSRPHDVKPLTWGVERGADADDPALTVSGFDAALVVADAGAIAAPEAATPAPQSDPHSDLDTILAAAGAVVPGRPAPAETAASNGEPVKASDAAADQDTADQDGAGSVDAAAAAEGVAAGGGAADLASSTAPARDTSDAAGDSGAVKPPAKQPAGPPATKVGTLSIGAPESRPEPAVAPLLIVPVDHDLRPSISRSEAIAVESAADRTGRAVSGENARTSVGDGLDDDLDDGLDREFEHEHDELARRGELDADEAEGDADDTASIDPLLRMFNRNDT